MPTKWFTESGFSIGDTIYISENSPFYNDAPNLPGTILYATPHNYGWVRCRFSNGYEDVYRVLAVADPSSGEVGIDIEPLRRIYRFTLKRKEESFV